MSQEASEVVTPSLPSLSRSPSIVSLSSVTEVALQPEISLLDEESKDYYKDIDWERVTDLQQPWKTLRRTKCHIYKYGWRLQSQKKS